MIMKIYYTNYMHLWLKKISEGNGIHIIMDIKLMS